MDTAIAGLFVVGLRLMSIVHDTEIVNIKLSE